jgi:hypothetical protein
MGQRRGDAGGRRRLDGYDTWSCQSLSAHEGVLVVPQGPRATGTQRPTTAPSQAGQRFGRAQDAAPELAVPSAGGWEPTPIFQAVAAEWERHRRDNVAVYHPSVGTGPESDPLAALPGPRAGVGPVPVPRVRDAGRTGGLAPVPVVPPPPPHGTRRDHLAGHRPGFFAPTGERDHTAAVPAPRAGTGPVPIPRARDTGRTRDLARHRSGVPPTDERYSAGWVPEPRSGTRPLPIQQPRDAGRWSDLASAAVVPPLPPGDRWLEDELTRRAQRRRRPLTTNQAVSGRHALAPPQKDAPTLHEGGDAFGVVADVLTFSGIT